MILVMHQPHQSKFNIFYSWILALNSRWLRKEARLLFHGDTFSGLFPHTLFPGKLTEPPVQSLLWTASLSIYIYTPYWRVIEEQLNHYHNSSNSYTNFTLLKLFLLQDLICGKQAMATLFSKLVTGADIEGCLAIPACSLGPLPSQQGHSMNMRVHDDEGQEWTFPCFIQRNENVEPFLSVGWIEFARQRNLRIDDKVSIHEEIIKIQDTATFIRIQVERKLRVFGADIWATVKNWGGYMTASK